MRPVELVMVGAGNRGYLAYGAFAERNPDLAKFVAVVEPDEGRRARFANAHRFDARRGQQRDFQTTKAAARRGLRSRAGCSIEQCCEPGVEPSS